MSINLESGCCKLTGQIRRSQEKYVIDCLRCTKKWMLYDFQEKNDEIIYCLWAT